MDEQNKIFEQLNDIRLRIDYQTVCNDAGGNRMWRSVLEHVDEAINIIRDDKERYNW
jgi:hypothetical protein